LLLNHYKVYKRQII